MVTLVVKAFNKLKWVVPVVKRLTLVLCLLAPLGARAGEMVVQDFDKGPQDPGLTGTFQDDKGSTVNWRFKENSKRKGDWFFAFQYRMKANGSCGFWCRAGDGSDGQDWGKHSALVFHLFSKSQVALKVSFTDSLGRVFEATAPTAGGSGKWEKVTVPLSGFKAEEGGGAPALEAVRSVTFSPQNPNRAWFAIDKLVLAE